MTYSEIRKLNDRDFRKSRNFSNKLKSGGDSYNNSNNDDDNNKFKFKNSLIITPNLEAEFSLSGGIKYIKNHENTVFIVGDGTYIVNNGINKIPILIKREINKQSNQKKLIIEEKYNFEEKYDISQNIVLYFDENRIDFQILFTKRKYPKNHKDIINLFKFNFFIPELYDLIKYKPVAVDIPFNSGTPSKEINITNPNYLLYTDGKNYMTVIPDKIDYIIFKDKLLSLNIRNLNDAAKVYINFKVFLEKAEI